MLGSIEIRDEGGGGETRLSGRFPYNRTATLSDGRGGRPRKESFASRAFAFAVEDPEREIHLLYGHSFDRPLASKRNGTLILEDTDDALTFDAILKPDILEASWTRDFLAALRAGLIAGISPGFRVPPIEGAEKTVEEDPKLGRALIRTIAAAVLFELSAVTRPAYRETNLTERAMLAGRQSIAPAQRWRL